MTEGGKRRANKSLKQWVAFVKKVAKEEGLEYKDAMKRAKARSDKGEKWQKGGDPTAASTEDNKNETPAAGQTTADAQPTADANAKPTADANAKPTSGGEGEQPSTGGQRQRQQRSAKQRRSARQQRKGGQRNRQQSRRNRRQSRRDRR